MSVREIQFLLDLFSIHCVTFQTCAVNDVLKYSDSIFSSLTVNISWSLVLQVAVIKNKNVGLYLY